MDDTTLCIPALSASELFYLSSFPHRHFHAGIRITGRHPEIHFAPLVRLDATRSVSCEQNWPCPSLGRVWSAADAVGRVMVPAGVPGQCHMTHRRWRGPGRTQAQRHNRRERRDGGPLWRGVAGREQEAEEWKDVFHANLAFLGSGRIGKHLKQGLPKETP